MNPPPDLRPVDLRPASKLAVQAFRAWIEEEPDLASVLVLRAEGVYGPGSRGNPDARFLLAALGAARALEAPDAILVDLERADYRWGDALLMLWNVVEQVEPPLPLHLVGGPRSEPALRSLLGPAADRLVHASFEAGFAAVSALALARAREADARERATPSPPPPGAPPGPP